MPSSRQLWNGKACQKLKAYGDQKFINILSFDISENFWLPICQKLKASRDQNSQHTDSFDILENFWLPIKTLKRLYK